MPPNLPPGIGNRQGRAVDHSPSAGRVEDVTGLGCGEFVRATAEGIDRLGVRRQADAQDVHVEQHVPSEVGGDDQQVDVAVRTGVTAGTRAEQDDPVEADAAPAGQSRRRSRGRGCKRLFRPLITTPRRCEQFRRERS